MRRGVFCFSFFVFVIALIIGEGLCWADVCRKECVQRQQVCVQHENKCVQQATKCAQTQQYCAQYENVCVQKYRNGNCAQYQKRCARYDQRCVQHKQECQRYQQVCVKYDNKCVQEKTVCPQTSGQVKQQTKRRMTCAECSTNRNRCFTGCDKIDNLIKRSDCVNRCNGAYSCVKGYDCD